MRKKILILTLVVIMSISLVTLVACDMFSTPKWDVKAPEFYDQDIDIGKDYIDVKDIYVQHSGLVVNYSINGGEWQSSGKFTGLQAGTTYKIGAKSLENDEYNESPVAEIELTTLPAASDEAPQATWSRDYYTVTLENVNNWMEVSWDKGASWGTELQHTYPYSGTYNVLVRYKEIDGETIGLEQTLSVFVNEFKSGNGTSESPYTIASYEDFLCLEDYVDTSYDVYVQLVEDITFPKEAVETGLFNGVGIKIEKSNLYFDGNNKKIISPKIKAKLGSNHSGVGLIGQAREIKNLTVENMELSVYDGNMIAADYAIGLLSGRASYIENCNVNGEIKINLTKINTFYDDSIGGIVGQIVARSNMSATDNVGIYNSSADVKLTYQEPFINRGNLTSLNFGGIVGNVSSKFVTWKKTVEISECFANIQATLEDIHQFNIGGILGRTSDKGTFTANISNSYCTGSINYTNVTLTDIYDESSDTITYVFGGIAGRMSGSIDSSWSTVYMQFNDIIVPDKVIAFAGGIIGLEERTTAEKTISNCLFAGDIKFEGVVADYILYSVTMNPSAENCYHRAGANIGTIMGSEQVYEEEYTKASWQKDTLKLDESIWNLVDGKMPTLK